MFKTAKLMQLFRKLVHTRWSPASLTEQHEFRVEKEQEEDLACLLWHKKNIRKFLSHIKNLKRINSFCSKLDPR